MSDVFSFQPMLSGGTISLRPLGARDYDALYSCASDKRIWEGHPDPDRYKEPVFKAYFEDALKSQALVIVDNATNSIIGSSRFYQLDQIPDDISIGFTFLARAYWGGQTNLELKRLMLAYAFRYFDVVWFHISPANIRSQMATLKIGAIFTHEEVLPISGKGELWYCYRIEKDAWQNKLRGSSC